MVYLLCLLGLVLVIAGSDFIVDGSCAIARKAHISEFVIGLTIVGFGTSCPELVVSLTGALDGIAAVSIGNVLGSNIFNVLLILGLTALILPIDITKDNLKKDIPVTLGVTILFVLLCLKGSLNLIDGILFIILFTVYMIMCFKAPTQEEPEPESKKEMSLVLSIVAVVAGLAALIYGGKLFVDNAVKIAHIAGVSDKFIAVTLLAGGTSFPELVTCIVAAVKKKGQLALGNILGSNVFNILLILGVSCLITPLSTKELSVVDYVTLVVSVLMIFISAFTARDNRISRFDGAIMLLAQFTYLTFLFITL